jgi:hypothetical protein
MTASKRSGNGFLRRLRGIKPAVMKKEQLLCGRLEPFERFEPIELFKQAATGDSCQLKLF